MATELKNILWVCRTSDTSSLARITDSILPLLSTKFNITLLSNASNLTCVKNVVMGSDCELTTYKQFIDEQTAHRSMKAGDDIRSLNMQYVVVQIFELIYNGNYSHVVLCNGIYEIDMMTSVLKRDPKYLTNKDGIKTKLVVWSPIDYVPNFEVVQNAVKADIFLTMTPVMCDIISTLGSMDCHLEHVGHGSDISYDNDVLNMSRKDTVNEINRMRDEKLVVSKNKILEDDIIILNANNYGPISENETSVENTTGTRKRLDITVMAFIKLLERTKNKKLKLWIHTDIKSFFTMLGIAKIKIDGLVDNLILSNNKLPSKQLAIIYKASDISIQTSYGEGWSLTNLEAALYGSLQVVPDFLACGYHFRKNRGILIPVNETIIKNEGKSNVIIGVVTVENTTKKLLEALELLKNKEKLISVLTNAKEYSASYSWESVTTKLTTIFSD